MPVPKLPKTKAQLSTSVTIRLIPEDALGANALSDPSALANMVLKTNPIGAVESFDEKNDRNASARFEMNAAKPGVVLEVVPGLVTMRTITLRRVALYEADALKAFNINGDIVQQYAPFAMIKVETAPEGSGVADVITLFRGCWLTTNPKTFTLTGTDIKVIQSVTIAYAERDVTTSATPN